MSGNTISCSITINAVSECDGADLKELLGFKPTVSDCLTISTKENYPNIEFGDPLFSYIEVKSMGHNKFKVF